MPPALPDQWPCVCGHSRAQHYDDPSGYIGCAAGCGLECERFTEVARSVKQGPFRLVLPDEGPMRPIEHIEVNGNSLSGKEIGADIVYDIRMGTLTVTFLNVTTLHVAYKDQEKT